MHPVCARQSFEREIPVLPVWASYVAEEFPFDLFSWLDWFTQSDLISSESMTVNIVHSAVGKQLDNTICVVLLNLAKIKSGFTTLNQMSDTTQPQSHLTAWIRECWGKLCLLTSSYPHHLCGPGDWTGNDPASWVWPTGESNSRWLWSKSWFLANCQTLPLFTLNIWCVSRIGAQK